MNLIGRPEKTLKWINSLFFLAIIIGIIDFLIYQPKKIGYKNIIGITLFIIGILVYIIAKNTLGNQFSNILTTVNQPKLITHGVYRFIRHPYYTGCIFIGLGSQLFLNSIPGLVIMTLPIMITLWIIPIEEQILIETFEDEYILYMKRTKKIIPFIY
jgi:protein-S-isoprenylcysteine O-methyltransferase Ste14